MEGSDNLFATSRRCPLATSGTLKLITESDLFSVMQDMYTMYTYGSTHAFAAFGERGLVLQVVIGAVGQSGDVLLGHVPCRVSLGPPLDRHLDVLRRSHLLE